MIVQPPASSSSVLLARFLITVIVIRPECQGAKWHPICRIGQAAKGSFGVLQSQIAVVQYVHAHSAKVFSPVFQGSKFKVFYLHLILVDIVILTDIK